MFLIIKGNFQNNFCQLIIQVHLNHGPCDNMARGPVTQEMGSDMKFSAVTFSGACQDFKELRCCD